MPREFVTADLHFGDRNMLAKEFVGRRFPSPPLMDAAMIRIWNDTVGKRDTVYVLGDVFAEHVPKKRRDYVLRQLNGELHLVIGNHDTEETISLTRWASVQDRLRLDLTSDEFGFSMTHKPPEGAPVFDGRTIHLHGHLHSRKASMPVYDVGVDAHGYKPVHLSALIGAAAFYRASWKQLAKLQGADNVGTSWAR